VIVFFAMPRVYGAVSASGPRPQDHSPETCGISTPPPQRAARFPQELNEITRKALKALSGAENPFYGMGAHIVVRRRVVPVRLTRRTTS
jgi:hypothetical protein